MAYVNVAEWTPRHVGEWLRGLDDMVQPYVQFFLNHHINGCHLLTLSHDDLDGLNIIKLGHQDLILEAVELLRHLHYNLSSENLQSLSLKLGCRSQGLINSLRSTVKREQEPGAPRQRVSNFTLAAVADILGLVKMMISWLDRYPFQGQEKYAEVRSDILKASIELASTAQRDQFAEQPHQVISQCCLRLAEDCDRMVRKFNDSLVSQTVTLDVASFKKKLDEDLGLHIHSSYFGIHIIGGIKFQSPAYSCGKIDEGDEIIQVNFQTVVGWQLKNLVCATKEHPTEIHLTLKKRPRHPSALEEVRTGWPHRLPSKRTALRGLRKSSLGQTVVPILEGPLREDGEEEEEEDEDCVFLPAAVPQPVQQRVPRRATISSSSQLPSLEQMMTESLSHKEQLIRCSQSSAPTSDSSSIYARLSDAQQSSPHPDIPNTANENCAAKEVTGGEVKKPPTPKPRTLKSPTVKSSNCSQDGSHRSQEIQESEPQSKMAHIRSLSCGNILAELESIPVPGEACKSNSSGHPSSYRISYPPVVPHADGAASLDRRKCRQQQQAQGGQVSKLSQAFNQLSMTNGQDCSQRPVPRPRCTKQQSAPLLKPCLRNSAPRPQLQRPWRQVNGDVMPPAMPSMTFRPLLRPSQPPPPTMKSATTEQIQHIYTTKAESYRPTPPYTNGNLHCNGGLVQPTYVLHPNNNQHGAFRSYTNGDNNSTSKISAPKQPVVIPPDSFFNMYHHPRGLKLSVIPSRTEPLRFSSSDSSSLSSSSSLESSASSCYYYVEPNARPQLSFSREDGPPPTMGISMLSKRKPSSSPESDSSPPKVPDFVDDLEGFCV